MMPLPPHNDHVAGPWMRIQFVHIPDDARSQRVEVDIAGELQEIRIFLTDNRLIAILEEMSVPTVYPVEIDHIARDQFPHTR